MKRFFYSFTLLILGFSLSIKADPVSLESAQIVAQNFYQHYSSRSVNTIADKIVYKDNSTPVFYVFTYEKGGFVIVAADDAVTPILGYSTTSTFDKNSIPINAQDWIGSYTGQISEIINKRIDNSQTLVLWNKIRHNHFSTNRDAVTPLCSSTWNQDCYYNDKCPSDVKATSTCGHVYVGCVATAMSQIMKFWNYPTHGNGTHTYTHPTYGTLSADFGSTTYNWANMEDNVTSNNDDVATLMFQCGVSVEMNYGVDGSGAFSSDVPSALVNYFSYSPTAEILTYSNFTNSNWIMMLKGELNAQRPIYYSGDNGAEGHAFVCDGYDSNDMFHFNWGWSGSFDGYFAIGALNPNASSKFNLNNQAIVRIHPPSSAPIADFTSDNTSPDLGATVTFTDMSTNNPTSWSWYFEGGTPSTSTSQNPQVTYSSAGNYLVALTVRNASGSDTKTVSRYISAGGGSAAWIKQNTGFSATSRGIEQIQIVSPTTVWALAYDGANTSNYIQEFTRTTDGGAHWTPGIISFPNSSTYGVSNIFPLSDNICYACMFPTAGTGGYIVKTTDGGNNWAIQSSATFSADNSWANFVYFFNENDGVTMGDPNSSGFVIYITADGGNTWTLVPYSNVPLNISGETGLTNSYAAVGDTLWFSTSSGRLYKTTDKGATWSVYTTGLSGNYTPIFKDKNFGIIVLNSAPYTMRKTTDGGLTWSSITPSGDFLKAPHLTYVKGTQSMWIDVCASQNSIGSVYSNDDCVSFKNIDKGSAQYLSVAFLDSLTGWAGGFNTSSSDGGIYKWNPTYDLTTDVNPIPSVNEKIKLYPNPTSDLVTVEFSTPLEASATITVYNLLGEKVRIFTAASGDNSASVSVSGVGSGMYILTVESNGRVLTTKRLSIVQ